MRILLLFTNAEIASLLSFSLDSYFPPCELHSHNNLQSAMKEAQSQSFDFAVVDVSREEHLAVFEPMKNAATKVLAFHPDGKAPPVAGLTLVGTYKEANLLNGITETLRQQGVEPKVGAPGRPLLPYIRVGVPLLLRTSPLICDVYIKLSELKFVKLFHQGHNYTLEDVEKYHGRKKIQHFYVRQEEAEKITGKLNEALEDLLRQQNLPKQISTAVSAATVEVIHDLVNQVGFKPEVQQLVKNNVELVLKELASIPSLGGILNDPNLEKTKYIGAHSHMLAETACALSIAMEWDSEGSFKKLAIAALLHDMCLSDHKLCRVKDLKELFGRRDEFSSSDVEEFRSHPRRASVLLQGVREIPADVDKMVLQHHELPIGTGFPEQVNHVHIHPMSTVLIVAHDLVDWVIDHPGPVNMTAFIAEHTEKFRIGNFKKILKALETLEV